jgi:hypothetical protein
VDQLSPDPNSVMPIPRTLNGARSFINSAFTNSGVHQQ